jgi:hypothetical protein
MKAHHVALSTGTALAILLAGLHDARACTTGSICYTFGTAIPVEGDSTGAFDGVKGTSTSTGHAGVSGTNSTTGIGVFATAHGGVGVSANVTNGGTALYATNTGTGYAIQSDGVMNVLNGFSYVYASTTCIAGFCASDARLKKNITPLSDALSKLLELRGVNYEWKDPDEMKPKGTQTGFIAQEVEKVFPKWVDQHEDGTKGIVLPPMQFAALAVEGIREVHAENVALKAKSEAQEKRAKEQDERIQALEQARRPVVSYNPGWGIFATGLVIGGAVLVNGRRRRNEKP